MLDRQGVDVGVDRVDLFAVDKQLEAVVGPVTDDAEMAPCVEVDGIEVERHAVADVIAGEQAGLRVGVEGKQQFVGVAAVGPADQVTAEGAVAERLGPEGNGEVVAAVEHRRRQRAGRRGLAAGEADRGVAAGSEGRGLAEADVAGIRTVVRVRRGIDQGVAHRRFTQAVVAEQAIVGGGGGGVVRRPGRRGGQAVGAPVDLHLLAEFVLVPHQRAEHLNDLVGGAVGRIGGSAHGADVDASAVGGGLIAKAVGRIARVNHRTARAHRPVAAVIRRRSRQQRIAGQRMQLMAHLVLDVDQLIEVRLPVVKLRVPRHVQQVVVAVIPPLRPRLHPDRERPRRVHRDEVVANVHPRRIIRHHHAVPRRLEDRVVDQPRHVVGVRGINVHPLVQVVVDHVVADQHVAGPHGGGEAGAIVVHLVEFDQIRRGADRNPGAAVAAGDAASQRAAVHDEADAVVVGQRILHHAVEVPVEEDALVGVVGGQVVMVAVAFDEETATINVVGDVVEGGLAGVVPALEAEAAGAVERLVAGDGPAVAVDVEGVGAIVRGDVVLDEDVGALGVVVPDGVVLASIDPVEGVAENLAVEHAVVEPEVNVLVGLMIAVVAVEDAVADRGHDHVAALQQQPVVLVVVHLAVRKGEVLGRGNEDASPSAGHMQVGEGHVVGAVDLECVRAAGAVAAVDHRIDS